MRFPPRLSKREIQALPYLIKGFTRKEIAEKIDGSEEVVKAVTRNLVRKFGYRTVRDAMQDLKDYVDIILNTDHPFFVSHNEITMYLNQNQRDCVVHSRMMLLALEAGAQTFTHSFIAFAEISQTRMGGKVIDPDLVNFDRSQFTYDLGRKLRRHQETELEIEVDYCGDQLRAPLAVFPHRVLEPTGSLKMSVEFAGEHRPKDFQLVARDGHHQVDLDVSIEWVTRSKVTVEVPDPQYMWTYSLLWR